MELLIGNQVKLPSLFCVLLPFQCFCLGPFSTDTANTYPHTHLCNLNHGGSCSHGDTLVMRDRMRARVPEKELERENRADSLNYRFLQGTVTNKAKIVSYRK